MNRELIYLYCKLQRHKNLVTLTLTHNTMSWNGGTPSLTISSGNNGQCLLFLFWNMKTPFMTGLCSTTICVNCTLGLVLIHCILFKRWGLLSPLTFLVCGTSLFLQLSDCNTTQGSLRACELRKVGAGVKRTCI